MLGRRTYIVSVHDREGDVVLEDVRTHRRIRVTELSEIGEQIGRWLDEEPVGAPEEEQAS